MKPTCQKKRKKKAAKTAAASTYASMASHEFIFNSLKIKLPQMIRKKMVIEEKQRGRNTLLACSCGL